MGRLSQRNKQPVWWANYVSISPTYDDFGNENGNAITYTTPRKAMWNVNVVDSQSEVEAFGINATDALRIAAEKDGFPLAIGSILWVGKEPDATYDSESPHHNFAVVGVKSSLNELVFYARKVGVS